MVFCDLRGFYRFFTETTEPEEAMSVLREYHAALGETTDTKARSTAMPATA